MFRTVHPASGNCLLHGHKCKSLAQLSSHFGHTGPHFGLYFDRNMTLSGVIKRNDSAPSGTLAPLMKKQQSELHVPTDPIKTKVWNYLGHRLAKLTTIRRKKLLEVVAKGNLAEVMEVLSHGVDVNVKSPLGHTPLYIAAARGHHQIVTLLLDRGAQVNDPTADGYTALYAACENNRELVAKLLLRHKARLDIAAVNGFTPLHIATKKGNGTMVKLLLGVKAKVDTPAVVSGLTPLMMACMGSHPELVELLLDRGADPDTEDQDGNTSLHFACAKGNYRATYLLLTAGADPDMPNARDETAFDVAAQQGHSHITYLLETNGVGQSVEEMDQLLTKDQQLNESLARNRPELAEIILKHRVKYAAFYTLGAIQEEDGDNQ